MVEKYRVKLPTNRGGGYIGTLMFYGVQFVNGEAENVTDNFALSEFKDWGCTVEPMKKRDELPPVTAEDIERVAKQVATAHKRAVKKPEEPAPDAEG